MRTILRSFSVPVSLASLTLGVGFAAYGCTTTAVNDNDGGGGGSSSSSSSSGSGGTSSSGTSSGSGSGSSSNGGSSGSGSGSGGSSSGGVDAGPVTCYAPPSPDGGAAVLTAGSTSLPLDGGGPYNAYFGNYMGYGGGTYFYPAMGPGTDMPANQDAGVYCGTLASQNSFLATFMPSSNSWVMTGTIATYSGIGMWQYFCFNGAAYSGIQFTVSGDVGIPAGDAGDAGTSTEMQLQVTELANSAITNSDGTAGLKGSACASNCNPATASFPVTSTPTVIQIPWTALTGGTPNATIDNPGQIAKIQFQLPWLCTGGVPYMTNVTITNISFYQ